MGIREGRPGDAEALAAVQVASWQQAYRGLVPDDFLDRLRPGLWRSAWDELLAETYLPGRGVLVAEAPAGGPVGFVVLRDSRDVDVGDAPTGEVTGLYVSPATWGAGIGRRLLAAAEDRLRRAGFAQATLWVLSGNARARRFYERAGWAVDGAEQEVVIAGVPLTGVRYRRQLQAGRPRRAAGPLSPAAGPPSRSLRGDRRRA